MIGTKSKSEKVKPKYALRWFHITPQESSPRSIPSLLPLIAVQSLEGNGIEISANLAHVQRILRDD